MQPFRTSTASVLILTLTVVSCSSSPKPSRAVESRVTDPQGDLPRCGSIRLPGQVCDNPYLDIVSGSISISGNGLAVTWRLRGAPPEDVTDRSWHVGLRMSGDENFSWFTADEDRGAILTRAGRNIALIVPFDLLPKLSETMEWMLRTVRSVGSATSPHDETDVKRVELGF